jgi:hypothetical protein
MMLVALDSQLEEVQVILELLVVGVFHKLMIQVLVVVVVHLRNHQLVVVLNNHVVVVQ